MLPNQLVKCIKVIQNTYYGPWAVNFDQISWVLAIFGPEMKIYRSTELPRCTEIGRNETWDIKFASKVGPYHFKFIIRTLSCRFWPNIVIFDFFGPKMKIHGSSEVSKRTEINMKATRDIEWTSKMDQNHLKYILGTLDIHFDQICI